jgi:hypothetical protein
VLWLPASFLGFTGSGFGAGLAGCRGAGGGAEEAMRGLGSRTWQRRMGLELLAGVEGLSGRRRVGRRSIARAVDGDDRVSGWVSAPRSRYPR